MGIVCKGFDGVLTEFDWAQMSGLMGNMPSVKAYNITNKDFGLAFITNDNSKPKNVPAVANWIAVGV